MSRADKAKNTSWDFDLRVRERNLAAGVLDQKVVDKHLADLPDLEAECETMDMLQPALGAAD